MTMICIWARLIFLKDRPSSCSNKVERASPGGVSSSPFFFSVNSLSVVSFDSGNSVSDVLGTNTTLESKFRMLCGGKYTPFSGELNSIRERSILLPLAAAEAFKRPRNVCFVGVKKRSSTLQKATETPIIARDDES